MPIYDYECAICGFEFERASIIADRDSPRQCPQCNSWVVKLVISKAPLRVFNARNIGDRQWGRRDLRSSEKYNERLRSRSAYQPKEPPK